MSGHARNRLDPARFNRDAVLPYSLRLLDFEIAMQNSCRTSAMNDTTDTIGTTDTAGASPVRETGHGTVRHRP